MDIKEPKNLVMLCDKVGTITGVITDDVHLKEKKCIGRKVTCLVSKDSLNKTISFLDHVIKKNVALNYEMFINTATGKEMLIFSGIKIDDKLLILATDTNYVMNSLIEEMSRISNEQTNIIRKLEKEKAQIARIERERIERDLHDSVSQTIFSTRIIAEVLPDLWYRDKKEAKRQLKRIKILTEESLTEMRRILLELRPDSFEDEDIEELLGQLVNSAKLRSNVNIEIKIEGKAKLNAKVKEAIYRITQEAINNSIKHSEATHIEIRLSFIPGKIQLIIYDNGNGFDPGKVSKNKYGLYIMHERAKSIGSLLDISSKKGKGTRIALSHRL